jgi:hypothetical protein
MEIDEEQRERNSTPRSRELAVANLCFLERKLKPWGGK